MYVEQQKFMQPEEKVINEIILQTFLQNPTIMKCLSLQIKNTCYLTEKPGPERMKETIYLELYPVLYTLKLSKGQIYDLKIE